VLSKPSADSFAVGRRQKKWLLGMGPSRAITNSIIKPHYDFRRFHFWQLFWFHVLKENRRQFASGSQPRRKYVSLSRMTNYISQWEIEVKERESERERERER
jgi:hypothetical protein